MESYIVLIDCIYSRTFKKIQVIRENSRKFKIYHIFKMNTSVGKAITPETS